MNDEEKRILRRLRKWANEPLKSCGSDILIECWVKLNVLWVTEKLRRLEAREHMKKEAMKKISNRLTPEQVSEIRAQIKLIEASLRATMKVGKSAAKAITKTLKGCECDDNFQLQIVREIEIEFLGRIEDLLKEPHTSGTVPTLRTFLAERIADDKEDAWASAHTAEEAQS